jgi:hypothetical protein
MPVGFERLLLGKEFFDVVFWHRFIIRQERDRMQGGLRATDHRVRCASDRSWLLSMSSDPGYLKTGARTPDPASLRRHQGQKSEEKPQTGV